MNFIVFLYNEDERKDYNLLFYFLVRCGFIMLILKFILF